jgi:hypothetical protein
VQTKPVRGMALLSMVLLASACSSADNGTTAPTGTAEVAGPWRWLANVSNSQFGVSCAEYGQLTLSQSGDQVSGVLENASAVCLANGHAYQFDPGEQFTGGVDSVNDFRYSDAACRFTGTLSGSPANKAQGQALCDIHSADLNVTVAGRWDMER